MSQRYTLVQKQTMWETWVRETIFADDGVYNYSSRHAVMFDFIQKGVMPYVKRKGYVFKTDAKDITLSFLRYLFALHLGEKVIFLDPHKNEDKLHFEEFEHKFDTMEMEAFWERWGTIEDFHHYAKKVIYLLPFFIWAQIHLQYSPAYTKLERLLDEVDDMENTKRTKESKGKEDPYLHDSSRPNYEDRHWH